MALEWKKIAFAEDVVSDIAYGAGWDGVTTVAPSKNAVYDQMELRAPKANPFFTGLITETSVAAEESAPLGDELLTSSGWTSADWTGDWASGWDHTTGNTTALLNSLAAVTNNFYQITYTVTGRTAGTFTSTFGGVTSGAYSATGAWGPRATSTGTLSITPTSTFDGTIVISIKQITGAYNPVYKILNSAGGTALEIRSTTNSNTAIGHRALYLNTTGYYNTAIGVQALYSNTTGINNTAIGYQSLYLNTTGGSNTGIGYYALSANTTGSGNTGIGYYAGRYTSASANNQTSVNSVYIGYDTRSSADGDTNEIVIGYSAIGNGSNTVTLGNTSVTGWYMGATKLIGVQGAAVADATGADDVVAQLNTLLARLRTHGLIAI